MKQKDYDYFKKPLSGPVLKFLIVSLTVTLFSMILGIYLGLHLSQWKLIDLLITVMPQNQISPAENILILGVDDVRDSKRSDTIMVLNINRAKNRVGLLSVPRDSRVEVPGHGYTKINHAYVYGGVELVKESVSKFLQIPIEDHVVLKLQGVRNIIDQLGGIEVDIKDRMYYVDKAGDLYIDFQPGKQKLDGRQAVAYLRFRHDKRGDIGRIDRQQRFLRSIAQKMLAPAQIMRLPQLLGEFNKHVDTSLSVGQIMYLVAEMKDGLEAGRIKVSTLPGAVVLIDGVSYWKVDQTAALKMIDETIHGFGEAEVELAEQEVRDPALGPLKKLTMAEISRLTPQEKVQDDRIYPPGTTLSVEVLNGNGYFGIASFIASGLKDKGLKIPYVANAAHFNYKKTVLVDWRGNTVESLRLAKALNISPANIIVYDKQAKTIDLCLVVGKDFERMPFDWDKYMTQIRESTVVATPSSELRGETLFTETPKESL